MDRHLADLRCELLRYRITVKPDRWKSNDPVGSAIQFTKRSVERRPDRGSAVGFGTPTSADSHGNPFGTTLAA
jgi:hypothetical protein